MRTFAVVVAVAALGGCAIFKSGATRACQDSCNAAHKSCSAQASSHTSGGSFGKDLANKEAQTACDLSRDECNKHCG